RGADRGSTRAVLGPGDRLIEGRRDRADRGDARLELGAHAGVELGVARRDERGEARSLDDRSVGARVAAQVDVLDADRVVEMVDVRRVAEARVLVLLLARRVRDVHALARELRA